MNSAELQVKLKNREKIYTTLIASMSHLWAPRMAGVGIDCIFIDTEHIPNDRVNISWVVQSYQSHGISAFLRVSSHDVFEIARAIDAGVNGILVPYVETVQQAKTMVGAVKYRPLKGEKLKKVLSGECELTKEEKEYLSNFNKNNYLFINIESAEGVKNLDDILKIEGIDGVIVGPHDLSVSLGVAEQYDHEDFEAALRTIIDTCAKNGKSIGMHSTELEMQKKWCAYGMNMAVYSSEMEIFTRSLKNELNELRKINNDAAVEDTSKGVII